MARITYRRSERGQSVVEFALVVPFLALAFALALQMAFLAYAKIVATNTAQEAARVAAVHTDAGAGVIQRSRDQAVKNVVRVRCQDLMPFFAEDAVTFTVEPPAEGDPIQDAVGNRMVSVEVTVTFEGIKMVYPHPIVVKGFGIAYLEPWPGPFGTPPVDIAPAP